MLEGWAEVGVGLTDASKSPMRKLKFEGMGFAQVHPAPCSHVVTRLLPFKSIALRGLKKPSKVLLTMYLSPLECHTLYHAEARVLPSLGTVTTACPAFSILGNPTEPHLRKLSGQIGHFRAHLLDWILVLMPLLWLVIWGGTSR